LGAIGEKKGEEGIRTGRYVGREFWYDIHMVIGGRLSEKTTKLKR